MLAFGQIAGGGVVHHGVGAVAFACVTVAVGTVFVVDGFGSVEIGVIGGERIFAEFVFEGDFPWRFMENGKSDGNEDQHDDEAEKDFDRGF